MEFRHIPVMYREVLEGLDVKADGIYVDCTLGGAGHSLEIAKRLNRGRLFAFDLDPEAIAFGKKKLQRGAVLHIRCIGNHIRFDTVQLQILVICQFSDKPSEHTGHIFAVEFFPYSEYRHFSPAQRQVELCGNSLFQFHIPRLRGT